MENFEVGIIHLQPQSFYPFDYLAPPRGFFSKAPASISNHVINEKDLLFLHWGDENLAHERMYEALLQGTRRKGLSIWVTPEENLITFWLFESNDEAPHHFANWKSETKMTPSCATLVATTENVFLIVSYTGPAQLLMYDFTDGNFAAPQLAKVVASTRKNTLAFRVMQTIQSLDSLNEFRVVGIDLFFWEVVVLDTHFKEVLRIPGFKTNYRRSRNFKPQDLQCIQNDKKRSSRWRCYLVDRNQDIIVPLDLDTLRPRHYELLPPIANAQIVRPTGITGLSTENAHVLFVSMVSTLNQALPNGSPKAVDTLRSPISQLLLVPSLYPAVSDLTHCEHATAPIPPGLVGKSSL